MRFARWVFALAGIYGLIVTIPLYFMEQKIAVDSPPPITHPEYYYGFAGLCLAWQVLFLVIAIDPLARRAVILVGILEKLSLVLAILYLRHEVSMETRIFAAIDAVWAVLFAAAYLRVKPDRELALLLDRPPG